MSERMDGLGGLAEAYAAMLVRAGREPAFRERLKVDPKAVLAEAGLVLPPLMSVSIVENSPTLMYLPLPPLRPAAELSDQALDGVTGGAVLGLIGFGVVLFGAMVALAGAAAIAGVVHVANRKK